MRVRRLERREEIACDFLAVGHVTLDRFEHGAVCPGGTALYSGLLAARSGLSGAILTAGDPERIAQALSALDDPLDVVVLPSERSTELWTEGTGRARRQRALATADPVPRPPFRARLVHLAPVLRELEPAWLEPLPAFGGLTPQGLLRRADRDGWLAPAATAEPLRHAADAVVYSVVEAEAYERSREGVDPLAVVTDGAEPARVMAGERRFERAGFPRDVVDDMGAGDVFAAALFVELEEGGDPARAVDVAHAAAALRVSGRGLAAVPSIGAARRLADRER